MEFDTENDTIITDSEERRVLRTPDYVEWRISSAWKLLELVEVTVLRVDSIDPSITPVYAERQRLLRQKEQDGALLRTMMDELGPYVGAQTADEVERFLENY